MGAHCGSLCCKPCRRRVDIKDKIKDLFKLNAADTPEQHAVVKSGKLCSYLRDRMEQLPKCGKLIDDQTKMIIDQEQWSPADVNTIKIALVALKQLMGQFPQHFMSFSYTFAYRLITTDHFTRVKLLTYDLVTQCAKAIQQESSSVSDQFLQELIQYCEVNSNLIGKDEFGLVSLLITANPLSYEVNATEEQQLKWTKLLELVLKHLLSDFTLDPEQLVSEEKQLLETLFEVIACNMQTTNYLCNTLLQFLQGNGAWGGFSDLVLELLFERFAKGKADYLAEVFKTFVFFLHSLTSDQQCNPAHIKFFIHKLISSLSRAKGSVPTLTYNSTLSEIFLALLGRSELKAIGLEMLMAWCTKTDQQSFLKMVHQLSIDERADHNYDLCLTQLKRHLAKRLDSVTSLSLYDDLNKEISQLVTLMHEAFPSVLILKTLSFIIRLIRLRMKLKPYEASSLHTTLLSQLHVHTNALTYQSLKMVKYCSTIWLCTAALASPIHLDGLLKVAVQLQTMGSQTSAPGMQLALFVALVVHLHAIGVYYHEPRLVEFSVKIGKEHIPRDLYPGLLDKERWEKVCSFSLRLFRKQQFNHFEGFSTTVPFGKYPLTPMFTEFFPQAVHIADLENEYRHSVDPLDTINSESSLSSQYSEVGGRMVVEPSEVRLEVGAAAIAKHEDEQQQLLLRLADKS